MNRWCVIVTGSRRLGYAKLPAVVNVLARYSDAEHVVVLHGAYRGADDLARDAAAELGFADLGIPYFGHLGTKGGQPRNRCLVDAGVTLHVHGYKLRLHAFPDEDSVGTWGCVRYAESKGVECEVHRQ
jgi:hypothetical protein